MGETLTFDDIDVSEEELQHWGIKGMKWGIRRFQNKDGSLTPAGKKRYDDDQDGDTETTEQKRERILKSTNAKEIYENRHLLSTNELNERINRIDTEARLASKIPTETTKTGNDRMRDAKNTIDNATNLYRSVDNAYSAVVNSTIGKTLAKKLGLDVPKKEFNAEEFLANINKKTTQEVMDFSKRMTAEKMGRKTLKELQDADKAEKEAKEAEERAKKNLEDAQKQVDDYNKSGHKDDKVSNPSSEYSKTADDLTDNKTAYGASKKVAGLIGEAPEKVSGTVEGEGKSKFEGWKKDTVIDADYTEVKTSSVPKATVSLGQRTIAGLLEDKRLHHSDLDDYLAHFGIKGMKWGVRRYQNKDGSLTAAGKKRVSKAQKDASKLADKAKTYYESVNKQNALYDTTGHMDKQMHKIIDDGYKLVTKEKTKLDRKYSDVVIKPEFEKNGYVVKAVETSITKLDRLGRISSISKSYTPVETYNRWRDENPDLTNKIAKLQKERSNKLKTAKTIDDVERIEMEYEEKIDDI